LALARDAFLRLSQGSDRNGCFVPEFAGSERRWPR
jgi:hypothetical protein